jgi:hypothetical protein
MKKIWNWIMCKLVNAIFIDPPFSMRNGKRW